MKNLGINDDLTERKCSFKVKCPNDEEEFRAFVSFVTCSARGRKSITLQQARIGTDHHLFSEIRFAMVNSIELDMRRKG